MSLHRQMEMELDTQNYNEGYCTICGHKVYNMGLVCRNCASIERILANLYRNYQRSNLNGDIDNTIPFHLM